jgi:nucleoside 2-deoxyribosyltransferase
MEEKKKVIYLMGSLKNWEIINIAKELRTLGFEVFDSWISPGPEADDFWRQYSKQRGLSHKDALNDWSAQHIYEFDKHHIDRADIGIMIMPCGKSGHLELGYLIGQGKPGFILFNEEPERWDIMHLFANGIYYNLEELKKELLKLK